MSFFFRKHSGAVLNDILRMRDIVNDILTTFKLEIVIKILLLWISTEHLRIQNNSFL